MGRDKFLHNDVRQSHAENVCVDLKKQKFILRTGCTPLTLNLSFFSLFFKGSMTASILTQESPESSKVRSKPNLDTLFSNMLLQEEKNGKGLKQFIQRF